jgi:hypothetical protein
MKLTEKQSKATRIVLKSIMGDLDKTFLLYGGAIRGGKTYWALLTTLMLCEIYPNSRWAVIRKDSRRLSDNTLPSFHKLLNDVETAKGEVSGKPSTYTHSNGSQILFRGENIDRDPELDGFKGFEVNGFIAEEINELNPRTFNKMLERAGSWIIPNLPKESQPKPFIFGTCNPTNNWVKDMFYTPWKEGTLKPSFEYISAKITDNPHLPQSYIDSLKSLPIYEYRVFVEGDWDVMLKTGGEFWRAFDIDKHVKQIPYDQTTTIHISVDSNVHPYVAVSCWQFDTLSKVIKQIHEIPNREPFNYAGGAGSQVVEWLKSIDYTDIVYLYGDATTRAGNTIDKDKKSFYDLFTEAIAKEYKVIDRMPRSNPSVSSSGEFINALYDNWQGWSIQIDERCKESQNDYIETKVDKDGGVLKTRVTDKANGISYEKNGHISDTKRYVIVEALFREFEAYKNRFEQPKEIFLDFREEI